MILSADYAGVVSGPKVADVPSEIIQPLSQVRPELVSSNQPSGAA